MLRLPVVLCVVRVANENTSPAPGGLSPRLLARAIALMREHDEESLDELAAALHLSRGYFMRAFRAATGETPHRWRLRDRLDRAMTLLREPAASIADVAIACGFADQSHLTRLFVRQVGLGPGAWRRRVAGAHH